MTIKSLLIFSISFSLVLIASTLYIAENTSDGSMGDIQNSTTLQNDITFQVSFRNDPDPSALSTFNPINNTPQSNMDPKEPAETILKENKPLLTVIINNVLEGIFPNENPVASNNEFNERGSQSNSPSSTLDKVVNDSNGLNFKELLENAPLTDSQLDSIAEYSGGTNPMELVDQFCGDVRSGEFHNMTEDIRRSYNYNPASPAILMSIFEKMGDLCP